MEHSILSITPTTRWSPPGFPVSNSDFLTALFPPESVGDAYLWVTAFAGDPNEGGEGLWRGYPIRAVEGRWPAPEMAGHNTFYTISSFRLRVLGDGRTIMARSKAAHAGTFVIVIDDVGDGPGGKLNWADLQGGPMPTYILETSPRSCQVGYGLSIPVLEREAVDAFVDALLEQTFHGATDPGMRGVTRNVRMPVGSNGKKKYGDVPFVHRLLHWAPETCYELRELIEGFGLGEGVVRHQQAASERRASAVALEGDLWWTTVREATEVLGPPREAHEGGQKVDILCPWADEHTDGITGSSWFAGGGYKCHHGHCEDRTGWDVKRWLLQGGNEPEGPSRARVIRLALDAVGQEYFADILAQPYGAEVAPEPSRPLFKEAPTSPPPSETEAKHGSGGKVRLQDFYAHLPDNTYIFRPTRQIWSSSGVNGHLPQVQIGPEKFIKPSKHLDRHHAVQQLIWSPGDNELIRDRLMNDGGWIKHQGAAAYNSYLPPPAPRLTDRVLNADLWLEHLHKVYPKYADHIMMWFAHRLQRPAVKINHALMMGGKQGIGKDSLLEPVKCAVGSWNWGEQSPEDILGAYNPWVKNLILRINEAVDLGEVNRFAFYERSKTLIAAPPDVLPVVDKYVRQHMVVNVVGVIITTNQLTGGLYLPRDDRRHYVCWSECDKTMFDAMYWERLWRWFDDGGLGRVAEHLLRLDLAGFSPKAPPEQTEAFDVIVASNTDPVEGDLAEVLDAMGNPPVLTLDQLKVQAYDRQCYGVVSLFDKPRSLPHKMGAVGYHPCENPSRKDGRWKIDQRNRSVYMRSSLTLSEAFGAIELLRGGHSVGPIGPRAASMRVQ